MPVFSHGGKYGDLLYALPAVRALGGGELILYPNPHTGMMFTRDTVGTIKNLLEIQPYIRGVRYAPRPEGLTLDGYRQHFWGGLNIADAVCSWLGLPHPDRNEPWLSGVGPHRVAPVVFARSPRYRNPEFPWARAAARYGRDAVFIGTRAEYEDVRRVCGRFARFDHYPTADLLAAARVIAGADLFVGNQSTPRAIAEGLKVPVVQETCWGHDNCHWDRENAWYGYRPDVYLPDPAELVPPGRTLVDHERVQNLIRLARSVAHRPGEAAELGVYRGGTARVVADHLPGKTVHLFDTFRGIPADDAEPAGHRAGEFPAAEANVRTYLAGRRVEFHPGEFPGTAAGLGDLRFAFVHLDADTYQSSKAGVEWFVPRLTPGGVVVFDDYDWPRCPGVRRAVEEAGLAVEAIRQQAWYRSPADEP